MTLSRVGSPQSAQADGGCCTAQQTADFTALIMVPYIWAGQRFTVSRWAALTVPEASGLSLRHVQALEATVGRLPKAKDYRNLKS
ncbi:hypothetical protein HDV57DRAFT_292658 [Trichoderma longibrachiatum]